MKERFSMTYNQAYPRVSRYPRGWTSSEFNSRQGLTEHGGDFIARRGGGRGYKREHRHCEG
jgi:hypothetical protein